MKKSAPETANTETPPAQTPSDMSETAPTQQTEKEHTRNSPLRERIRGHKRSVMRQIEYRRLKRIRKRTVPAYTHCKNCGEKLQGMYCHRCGQYALDIRQSFWKFIRQYFENVYQFDSKIWQTLYLLFRRPGLLTQKFNEGKINSYVHPFRLYMCVSVVFFTIFFMIASNQLNKTVAQITPYNMPDTVLTQLKRPEVQRDTVVFLYDFRGLNRALKERGVPTDSLLRAVPLEEKRGLARVELPRLLLDSCLFATTLRKRDRALIERFRSEPFLRKIEKGSIDNEDLTAFEATKKFQLGKTKVYDWREIDDEDSRLRMEYYASSLLAQISKWTPLFMLFMLPLFALLTKLAYRKKRLRYMQHFVHAIHINTVFLLLLAVPLSIFVASSLFDGAGDGSAVMWSFLLFYAFVLGYMLVSFRRVYGLGWVRTAIKTLEVFCAFTLLAAGAAAGALLWLVMHLADSF